MIRSHSTQFDEETESRGISTLFNTNIKVKSLKPFNSIELAAAGIRTGTPSVARNFTGQGLVLSIAD